MEREPAKAPKQSSIDHRDQRMKNQPRAAKSSFSPVLNKAMKGVPNLDEHNGTKVAALLPVRERASYAAS